MPGKKGTAHVNQDTSPEDVDMGKRMADRMDRSRTNKVKSNRFDFIALSTPSEKLNSQPDSDNDEVLSLSLFTSSVTVYPPTENSLRFRVGDCLISCNCPHRLNPQARECCRGPQVSPLGFILRSLAMEGEEHTLEQMTTAPVASAKKRFLQFDGLRALAVSTVLLSHFGLGSKLEWLTDALDWGSLGVRLFFVLSGFLITRILLSFRREVQGKQLTATQALKKFYIRRTLRIFPLFYAVLLVTSLLDVQKMRDVVLYHAFYLSNLSGVIFLSTDPLVFRDATSAHFWSLAVEEQFYLLWPAAVILIPSRKFLQKLLITAICLAPVWRASWFLLGNPLGPGDLLACLDTLGAGAALAVWHENVGDIRTRFRRYIRPLGTIGTWIFIACVALRVAHRWYRPYTILIDWGAATAMTRVVHRASLEHNDRLGRLLQLRPLAYIGKISYGIYVGHAFMSPLLTWCLTRLHLPLLTKDDLSRTVILTAMTLAFASASWFLFERHFVNLKDRLAP